MSNDATKRMREIFRDLRKQGFDVRQTKSGHFRVEGKNGHINVAGTPGSPVGLRNQIARLKQIGYTP